MIACKMGEIDGFFVGGTLEKTDRIQGLCAASPGSRSIERTANFTSQTCDEVFCDIIQPAP